MEQKRPAVVSILKKYRGLWEVNGPHPGVREVSGKAPEEACLS